MNAAKYKAICQQLDIFERLTIEQTARLMPTDSLLRPRLNAVLNQEPIQKPDLYRSQINNDDRFKLDFSVTEAEEIISILLSLEAEAVSPDGRTNARASSIAGLVDVWHNHVEARTH